MTINRRPKKLNLISRPNWQWAAIASFCCLVLLIFLTAGFNRKAEPINSNIITDSENNDVIFLPTPTRSIAKGERIGLVEFIKVRWPKSQVSAGYLRTVEGYEQAVALTPLPELLPIPIAALSPEGLDSNGVVEAIPDTMRAITVKVDAEAAVEGWALPGNFVDVILIRPAKDKDLGLEATVVSENIKILSAGRSIAAHQERESISSPPSTVTLLVTQEDALRIKTAANIGKLTFALRGKKDVSPAKVVSLNQRDLLGQGERQQSQRLNLMGFAKGPDGREYVLAEGSQWLRTSESVEDLKRQELKDSITP